MIAYRKSARVNADPDSPETWVDDGRANTLNRFDVGDVRTTHAVVGSVVRRLCPTETEALMGWPRNWTAPEGVKAPDSRRYAACGDGIVANVAYWIGQRIMQIDKETQ
jgi:site-specific DNA-cytosine methylase